MGDGEVAGAGDVKLAQPERWRHDLEREERQKRASVWCGAREAGGEGAQRGIRQWRGQAEPSLLLSVCLPLTAKSRQDTETQALVCGGSVSSSLWSTPPPPPRSTDAPSPHCPTCSHRMPARGAQFPSPGGAPAPCFVEMSRLGVGGGEWGFGGNPQPPQQGLGSPFSCRKGLPPSPVSCMLRHLFLLNEPLSRQCSVRKGGTMIPRHRLAGAVHSFPRAQEPGSAHYRISRTVAQGGA